MRNPVRSRGFTLIELLVGAAVGAVVLLGISLTFISQAQQYQAHAGRRALQANARQGLTFVGRHVRMAGYGVNPDRAVLAYDSYDVDTDASVQGFPDAFVVHWRDTLFRRTIVTAAPAALTVSPALSVPMRRGQILLLVCGSDPANLGENPTHAFVTVSQYLAAGTVNIPLDSTAPSSAPNSPVRGPGRLFHEQATLNQPCFNSGDAQVVMINRAAFYVASFDDDGNPGTAGTTPYLMMHQGLDMPTASDVTGDTFINRDDAVPVVEGIEQLQVAYILHTNDATPPRILGVNAVPAMNPAHYGEDWESINLATLPSGWFFNSGLATPFTPAQMAAMRTQDHPANIRQIRMTLISRSSLPESNYVGDDLLLKPDLTNYPDGPPMANGTVPWRHLENLTEATPDPKFAPRGGGYLRFILRESITPKNLLLNRQFVPITKGGG